MFACSDSEGPRSWVAAVFIVSSYSYMRHDQTQTRTSSRWLAPVLSHTLPLPAVLMAWDAIFAQAEMTRQSNPRLDHLLDICTAMLVRARAQLLLYVSSLFRFALSVTMFLVMSDWVKAEGSHLVYGMPSHLTFQDRRSGHGSWVMHLWKA